jgi:hypothetical protein
MITYTHAILSLRPNAEWLMTDNDVENIVWHTAKVKSLTVAEVEAEVARLESKAAAQAELDEVAKIDAIAHAKTLGFTDEMIVVMYPNLAPTIPDA